MQAVPLLLMAGGTAMQMSAQRDQQKDQRRILNRQMEANSKATDKAAQMVQDEASKMAPDARQQEMAAQEQAAFQQQQQDLRSGAGGGALIDTAGSAGNVSADFLKGQADRALDEGNRLTAIARETAKLRAPGMTMTKEGLGRAGLAGALANMWGSRRNLTNAAGMDAQNVQAPAYGALGGALAAYGASSMGNGGGLFASPQATPAGYGLKPPSGVTGLRPGTSGSGLRVNWG